MNNEIIKNKVQKLLKHYEAGNYKFVIDQIKILLKKLPNNIFLFNLLGSSLQRSGDQISAKKIFLNILNIDSKNIHAMNNLANTLKILNEFSLAEEYYLKILKINPIFIEAIVNYGSLNYKLNNFEKATELFKRALTINNDDPLIHYNMGLNYQSLGSFEEARFHFKEIQRINPNNTFADRLISKITKYTNGHHHLEKMIKKLESKNLTDDSKINLYFSLSKAFEDFNNFDRSYFYLKKGNDLKNKVSSFDVDINNKLVKDLVNFFETYQLSNEKKITTNKKNKDIIFILGLPRSGTSLVEQIISSHPEVYGAGELDFLESLIKNNFYFDNKLELENLSNDILSMVSEKYHNLIGNFNANEKIITDKALHNFLWIGFIRILFPHAKIIHCVRDKKDNCLSIYKNIFDENINWAYNQSKIISFYKDYSLIMKFWKKKFPGYIFDLNYENLVSNTKVEVNNLLNFCDLKWNDDCLNFYKTKRQVKTVSFAQVRSPIYNTSVNSNKKFEPFLSDFFLDLENIH